MSGAEEKIAIVFHPDYLVHTRSQHPERKERLEALLTMLEGKASPDLYKLIEPVEADLEDVRLIHSHSYIASVEEACREGRANLDPDTYLVPESYRIALLAVGGALAGLDEVMRGECRKAFAMVRPPGHHAESNRAMGFCLFNNIAVAAAKARKDYGLTRIAIVDWDVHHGNGTQHSFEEDEEVLFISLHQSPAFPGTGEVEEVGREAGAGYTVNLPLPPGCGDGDYEFLFDQVVVPVLEKFRPELILVSAGQDALDLDPLASMELTPRGYYQMAAKLKEVAGHFAEGRILLCLEGGYNLKGQAEAAGVVLNALGSWGLPDPSWQEILDPSGPALGLLNKIRSLHGQFWSL